MSNPDMDILSPEGTILKDPGQVERALAEMWKDAGEAVTIPDCVTVPAAMAVSKVGHGRVVM